MFNGTERALEDRQSILFVDDEPFILEILEELYEEFYRVYTAATGAEALMVLETERIDLLVTDQKMPGMTGAQLIAAARTKHPELLAIVLTAYSDPPDLIALLEGGPIFRFVTKPWDTDELTQTIHNAASQAKLKRELKETQEKLAAQERLATLGRLAAGVGHEISNPLTYVRVNLEVVIEELRAGGAKARGDDLVEPLEEALEGVERAVAIVKELRSFSRKTPAFEPVDVGAAATKAVQIVRTAEQDVEVQLACTSDGAVMGSAHQLGQVIINLVTNAIHASAPGGPAVQVDVQETASEMAVVVRDAGTGISPEDLSQIFEPFFSRKTTGRGTGLGLAICEKIVSAHHGKLEVSSEVEVGTVFTLRLPKTQESVAPVATEKHLQISQSCHRILLVDDEPNLLRAYTRSLGRRHRVRTARNGRHAMTMLADDANVDVIFCDLMMPDIDGIDFYERVSRQYPELRERVVFITGATGDPRFANFIAETDRLVLPKPVNLRQVDGVMKGMRNVEDDDEAQPVVGDKSRVNEV